MIQLLDWCQTLMRTSEGSVDVCTLCLVISLHNAAYIRTHEGWSYLSVVIDLFSRRVVGWSMRSRMTADLPLQALLSARWRRKPKHRVMIHSDQGSQFTSTERQSFLGKHNLDASPLGIMLRMTLPGKT